MIKNILIVTFNEDWDQCRESLLPSISKYVPGAVVKVVDNSLKGPLISVPSFDNIFCERISVFDLLSEFTTIPGAESRIKVHGSITQQLCKLSGYKLFDSPFVVIDSEIEVLRELSDWPTQGRSQEHFFKEFTTKAAKELWINDSKHNYLLPQVPYILDPKVLEGLISAFGSVNECFGWFVKQSYPSEFMLYDLFKHKDNPQPRIHSRTTESSIQYVNSYPYQLDHKCYDLALVHRDAWAQNNATSFAIQCK